MGNVPIGMICARNRSYFRSATLVVEVWWLGQHLVVMERSDWRSLHRKWTRLTTSKWWARGWTIIYQFQRLPPFEYQQDNARIHVSRRRNQHQVLVCPKTYASFGVAKPLARPKPHGKPLGNHGTPSVCKQSAICDCWWAPTGHLGCFLISASRSDHQSR